jgi:ABC-type Fe3+/spermidine/putrescine transport system ATPase subunit
LPNLQLMNIGKSYKGDLKDASPLFTLHPVNLTIEEGEFFALLGPSGCGKTTLLKLIAGLIPADQGDIFLGSENVSTLPAEKRGFGMVFQQPLLFPHMTAQENVAFGLKMQGIRRQERLHQAEQILEGVGLKGYGPRYPSAMSGGQLQRVSLARAIVSTPKLLLMDEPFSALDPGLRDEMRELVKYIHSQYKTTIIFVTHDREEAFLLADRMAVMMQGSIRQIGSPQDIYENPQSPEIAFFMGAKNVWEGETRDGHFISGGVKVKLGPTTDELNGRGWLVIRPESVHLSEADFDLRTDIAKDKYSRSLQGTVQEISYRQGLYHLKIGFDTQDLFMIEKPGFRTPPKPGDAVSVQFDIRQAYFIPHAA